MRRGTIGLAVFTATLLSATQAVAAGPPSPSADVQREARAAAPDVSRSAFSSDWITLDDKGSTAMLRSLPVAEGFDVGVGLFDVVGASEKELDRRRTDPRLEVRAEDRRVPGVGMSLRF